ncbi:MAG: hypothetical protein K6G56_02620 [Clostridiales bacterium]|nr:hypothetical protein [Clostridiales bacterium]
MNNEDLFRAVGEADDSVLNSTKIHTANRKRLIAYLAAAALLTVGAAVLILTKPWENSPKGEHSVGPQAIPMMCSDPGVTPDPFVKPIPLPEAGATPNPEWYKDEGRKEYKSAYELAEDADCIIRARIGEKTPAMVQTHFDFDNNGDPILDESCMKPRTLYGFYIVEIYKGGKAAEKLDRLLTEGVAYLQTDFYLCSPDAPKLDCEEYILFLHKPEIGSDWLWDNCAIAIGGRDDVFEVRYDEKEKPYIVGRFPEMTFEWLRGLEN